MPARKSFLDLKSITPQQIQTLFLRAQSIEKNPEPSLSRGGQTAALLFFEPSTRTRFSFETVAHRMGLGPLVLDGNAGTSLEKGETLADTVLNLDALGPELLIVRAGNDFDMQEMSARTRAPVINAGWGIKGHPTQALLDVFTLFQEFQSLDKRKILFVGDIKHSRVVASHFELLEKMGAEVGLTGPDEFLLDQSGAHLFRRLEEGLEWCDAVIALRVQLERHAGSSTLASDQYRVHFGLNRAKLTKHLRAGAVFMHPGPINWGVEMDLDVIPDSRNRILSQVRNGVFVRESLCRQILEGRL